MYNVVNINEDLSVPQYPMNPASFFPNGKQPYNNFLQQQTLLNKDGDPLYALPGIEVLQTNVAVDGDSAIIIGKITNKGDAPLNAPIYITFYKNDTTLTNIIAVDTIDKFMDMKDSLSFSFTVKDLTKFIPFSTLWISINDSGGIYPYQSQCDLNGRHNLNLTMLNAAVDTIFVYCDSAAVLDVFANDIMVSCSKNEIKPLLIIKDSKAGAKTLVDVNNDIVYERAKGFAGWDSLEYFVMCNDTFYWAKVFIHVDTAMPVLNHLADLVFCNGANSPTINLTGTNIIADSTKWSVSYGTGGKIGMISESGTGTIPSFTATNAGTTPDTVKITVIPKSVCIGIPVTFTIIVNPNPLPTVPNPALTYWQYVTAPTLLSATGATPDAGYTLNWYQGNGAVYTGASNLINTNSSGLSRYYVSQENALGCESDKIPVFVLVVQPEVLYYIVCPNNDVTLGVKPVTDVDFYWYNTSSGGTALSPNPSDTITVFNVLSSLPLLDTFWVEPRVNDTVLARIPIYLQLSNICEGVIEPRIVGCMEEGTLLYKQDFGGNNASDPWAHPTGLPAGSSDLTYYSGGSVQGHYALVKNPYRLDIAEFQNVGDHTYLGDTTRGYMMFVDPANGDINKVLYKTDINNLCDGMSLSFSAWFMDINKLSNPPAVSPKIEMQMLNKLDNSIIITSGIVTIPKGNDWLQYGFDFDLPAGITDVTFRIINKDNSTIGNDLGIDDVEVRFCASPVVVNHPDTVEECERTLFTLSGTYSDDGTFGNNLDYRWEYSTTGNINVPSDWSIVLGSGGSTTTGIVTSSHPIPSLSLSDAGYYRLAVGPDLNKWTCRATSKVVQLVVKKRPQVSITGSNNICTGTTTQLSPTTGGTWKSTNDAIATVTIDGVVTGVTTTGGQVRFVFTSSETGCDDTTATITVGTFPLVDTIVFTDKVVCTGATIQFSNATVGGVWSLSNNNAQIVTPNTNTDNPVIITGNTIGQVYVTYTIGTAPCQSKSTFLLRIVATPEIKVGFE